MTAAQVPEPTAEQYAMAMEVEAWDPMTYDELVASATAGGDESDLDAVDRVQNIARAIAAAVNTERAKYVELANRWETFTKGAGIWEPEDARPLRDATDELREVIGE